MISYKERILKTGLKQSFIYPKIGVCQSVFSEFLNGAKSIPKESLKRLDYILQQYEKIEI